MQWLKYQTAITLKIGPFVDDADGNTVEDALTIAQADVRLAKNGGDFAQKNSTTSCTHDELGYYNCPLNTTDTGTLGRLVLVVHESGSLPVRHEYMVLPAVVYDSLVGGTDYLQADMIQVEGSDATTQIQTSATAALNAYDPPTKTEMDSGLAALNDLNSSEVQSAAAAALTAYDPPTKAEMDSAFATTNGYIDTEVAAILEDTGTTIPGQISALNNLSAAQVNTEVASALATYDPPTKAELDTAESNIRGGTDTLATLSGQLDDIVADTSELQGDWTDTGRLDTILDAIKAKTDNLPTDPADDSDIDSQLASIASDVSAILLDTGTDGVQVVGIKQAALADLFDTDSGTTYSSAISGSVVKEIADNAGGSALTEAGIADAVLDELLSGHTTGGSLGQAITDILTDTGTDGVTVAELKASALADLFNTDSGTTYSSAVAGSVVKETADNAGGSSLTESGIADAVLDELLSGHTTGGSLGKAVADILDDTGTSGVTVQELKASAVADLFNTDSGTTYASAVAGSAVKETADNAGGSALTEAGIADAVLDELLSGHTTAGSLGKAIADIEVDTNELQTDDIPGAIAALNDLDSAAVQSAAAAALTAYDPPTKTELDAGFAALNDLSAAEVNAEVDTALGEYDAPTKAELDSGLAALNDLSATEVENAVWDAAMASHQAAGSTGSYLTAAQVSADNIETDLENGGRLDLIFDDILADTNQIQGKLPANYIMGASGTSDRDDEIVTILAKVQTDGVVVSELKASALADLFNTDSGTTYSSAVAGSVVKETADNAGSSSLTEAGIADAVLDELLSGHTTSGSLGKAVSDILADTASDGVTVSELQPSAIADLFNTDSGTTYASAVAGSAVKETADNAGGSSLTEAGIADAVLDEAMAGHMTAGTMGAAIYAAGAAVGPVGAVKYTYTLTNAAGGAPIPQAKVWITTDAAGTVIVASGWTDGSGQVTFYLDAGTIYIWRQKAGWNFSNPDTDTIS